MRKISLFILALSFSFANAQELPAPSPSASLTQRVGLTDFTVEYSRPGVKDREIFGELVPYNEVWRTGANKATSIEFNTDVTFSGKTVPAGKYSIFTIPAEGKWSFMLNKETELWGANDYKQEQDALRIAVVPAEGEMTETFTIDFTNISANGGSLQISFANTVVSVPFEVETSEKAMSNIKEALSSSPKDKLWIVNRNAANYYLNNGLNKEEALKFIETSVKLKEDNWYSHYIHGEILSSLGRNKEAVQAAQKAMEIGQNEADKADKEFGYSAMLEEAITKWTKS
jgi:predicted negative regulator of RcsB-dependent stress response